MLKLRTFISVGLGLSLMSTIVVSLSTIEAQTRRQSRGRPAASQQQRPRVDYSQFSHLTHVTKQKLACDSCHKFPTANWKDVRKGDAAYADVAEFPEHAACLSCHRQQFFARETPAPAICSNCHVAVTPKNTARFLFPSLGDVSDSSRPRRDFVSEFSVYFPHETHLDVVSRNTRAAGPWFVRASLTQQEKQPPANCGVCHQTYQPQGKSDEEYVTKPPKEIGDAFWLKKGTFKKIPNSHTGCFSCHNADSGITPVSSDCQTCHKLPASTVPIRRDFDPAMPSKMGINDSVMLNAWRKRISAGAFRHEGGAHPDLACADCHPPARLNTVEVQTLRVPVTSCAGAEGCHATATLDDGGILNYEIDEKKKNASFVCTKCHITFGKQTVPASHVSAIPKASK